MKQNQSLKEFVQVKVYETLQTYLRDLEKLQFDNQEAVTQLIQTRSQLDRERIEKDTSSKQLKEVRDDARRRIDALERRCQELESDNQILTSQIKNADQSKRKNADQVELINGLEMKNKHVENENNTLGD